MKDKQQQTNQSENTLTEIFKYEVEAGVSEYHVMIHATRPEATYEEQLNAVVDTYCQLRESELQRLHCGSICRKVWKHRCFIMDCSK